MSIYCKFDQYKVVFNGSVQNKSPLIVGRGGDEETDSDILRDSYGRPFIPGSSFAGVLRHHFFKHYQEFSNENGSESVLLRDYFGHSEGDEGESSRIIFSDCVSLNDADIQIRDGIRIDRKIGIVEDKGKFDYEIIEPGAEFAFKIEAGVNNKDELLKFIATLQRDIKAEKIAIGAKTNLGFGRLVIVESSLSLYDLRNKHDIIQWLKKADNYFQADLPEPYKYSSDTFRIEFDFVIKDSLIIRHYSSNPAESDSAHIRSEGKNIIPGSSIKGAMRSRAERILKTLAVEDQTELFSFLFGNSSTSDKDNGKRYDGSIPSRIKINEVIIRQKVEANIQQRIKIDRFTGGTIDGALFDSMPIFSANHDIANKLIVDLKDPIDAEIGLMLLILKDLWTEDLPIGGEKNIGRGILQGKKAVISYKNWSIVIDNIDTVSSENKNKLEKYLKALNDADFKDHMKVMRERYYMREAANE